MFLLVFRGAIGDDVPVYLTAHRLHALDLVKLLTRGDLEVACERLDPKSDAWICPEPSMIWLIEFSRVGRVVGAEMVRDLEENPLR